MTRARTSTMEAILIIIVVGLLGGAVASLLGLALK
jgi:hypothetical protein